MRIIAGARRLLRNQPRPRSRSRNAKNKKESLMSLPQAAITFLNHNAATNSAAPPKAEDDLFQIGALDSFALLISSTSWRNTAASKFRTRMSTPKLSAPLKQSNDTSRLESTAYGRIYHQLRPLPA